jgi:hypothetical protein
VSATQAATGVHPCRERSAGAMLGDMEWVDLAVWIVVVLVALALGRGALDQPAFGLLALTCLAGLALCILFLIEDGATGWAWGSFAAGVVGLLALAGGARWLIYAEDRRSSLMGPRDEEAIALLAGLQLPLLATATIIAALMAFDVTTLM